IARRAVKAAPAADALGPPGIALASRRNPAPRGCSSPRTKLRAPMMSGACHLPCATFSLLRSLQETSFPTRLGSRPPIARPGEAAALRPGPEAIVRAPRGKKTETKGIVSPNDTRGFARWVVKALNSLGSEIG